MRYENASLILYFRVAHPDMWDGAYMRSNSNTAEFAEFQ